ncbi:acetate kinase, partial [Arthrospira platensis SPKY1]|nr:acetate kinase [Arthrospira platensis SPKY1]
MATRCGQIDPGVLLYLIAREGLGASALSDLLYKRSGLAGLSGTSGDMREIEAAGTRAAAEALDYFAYRCRREIAAMCASLGGLDALVFSAGIGEHA